MNKSVLSLSQQALLIRYACQFVDVHTAEDIVQEATLKFFLRRPSIEANEQLPWLYRVVKNSIIDITRHQKVVNQKLESIIREQPKELLLEEVLEAKELNKDLFKIASCFEDIGVELLLWMLYPEGTMQEFARKMNISDRTLRRKKNKFIKYLAKELKKLGYKPYDF